MTETDLILIPGKKYKICFFSLFAYPYLTNKDVGCSGGAEHQQVLLAKELLKKGHQISFIVNDFGQSDIIEAGGIRIYKFSVPESKKIRFLSMIIRFFTKTKYIWKILSRPDADIYYQRCAGSITGFLSLFCLLRRKKFVFSVASKYDVDGTVINAACLPKNKKFLFRLSRFFYTIGLRLADCVIVQNHEQQGLLLKNYSKKSTVIKSMFTEPDSLLQEGGRDEVLWVSSIQTLKQPELFIELAKKIPEVQFRMIGGPSIDSDFFKRIEQVAKNIPNLNFSGFVSPDNVQSYYERALFVVNTSTFEGFPNTFLEAWSNAIPVVSLNVDPDDIICDRKLGIHSRNADQLLIDVKRLIHDRPLRETLGMNGKKYLEDEHSAESIVKNYENVFDHLMSGSD